MALANYSITINGAALVGKRGGGGGGERYNKR